MATKLTPKKSRGKKPMPKSLPEEKDPLGRGRRTGQPRSPRLALDQSQVRLPAATIRALKELEAGEPNRYADADDLFQKLGIKLGKD